jgi:hypothetical protein
MGAAKSNPTVVTTTGAGRFDQAYQAAVDADFGLHHAIAFERVTGWPVHAAFASDSIARYYNEDSTSWAFDVRGMMTAATHLERIVTPIAQAMPRPADWRSRPGLMLGTQCLGADQLLVSQQVDHGRLADAESRICANSAYLALVPERPWPRYPGDVVARYAFRHCMVFAEALSAFRSLPAATMLPVRIQADVHVAADQQHHAVVLHPDGEVEDVWGKAPADRVAQRYGFANWRLCPDTHRTIMADGLAREPRIAEAIADADAIIRIYASA